MASTDNTHTCIHFDTFDFMKYGHRKNIFCEKIKRAFATESMASMRVAFCLPMSQKLSFKSKRDASFVK